MLLNLDFRVVGLDLGTVDGESYNIDAIGEIIHDLVMWKDVSKSSFWFGFGSLCFLSSCFTRSVSFRFVCCAVGFEVVDGI